MNQQTQRIISQLITELELDQETKLKTSDHGDWYQNMINHIIAVEENK